METKTTRRSIWFRATLGAAAALAGLGSVTAFAETAPVAPETSPTPRTYSGWELGATGETVFEHTRAGLRDPHFGMRLYRDDAVPGTLHDVSNPDAPGSDARAATSDGKHTFWDVAFGERMPVFTWYDVNTQRARYARGVQVNLDAGAFMLLDFDSQSSGVIDTDFRLGVSVDFRPWWDGWEHLSLSAGFFHESTHLGDEYVLSAATIQGQTKPPAANPALPYRANPSYEGLPVTASVDLPLGVMSLSGRLYGGASAYFFSALPNGAFPSEWRAGAELRWTTVDGSNANVHAPEGASLPARAIASLRRRSTGLHPAESADEAARNRASRYRRRRGAFAAEAAYELLCKRRYDHMGAEPGPATFAATNSWWPIQHASIMAFYNLDTERSSSNAVGVSLDWIVGRSPFGQLTEYTRVDALALGFSYYW
ncbi:MAG TPA: DUF1207 domain-containing protein [Polyangia bacterium]|nr:DUF1207 domain-containing protein [Polyangia bacterium]